jgi:hypothetical protein
MKKISLLVLIVVFLLGWTGLSFSRAEEQREVIGYNIFPNRSLDKMIEDGEYDWVNPNITADHFPIREKVRSEFSVVLFHFNRPVGSEDVIAEMNKDGYRPAAIEELLALGESQPNLQKKFPIVALGTIWEDADGCRHVVFLWGSSGERNLDIHGFGSGWRDHYRFAAVRK